MNPSLLLDESYLKARFPMAKLLAPKGGLLAGLIRLGGELSVPDFDIAVTSLNNITKIFPHVTQPDGTDALNAALGGAGADISPDWAWLRAVMEGAERYATMAYKQEEFKIATANELGSEAIDLDTVPRCSEKEYSDPSCPLRPASKSEKIRWVKGLCMHTLTPRWVPAVMTHLYLKTAPAEQFWQMITTGVAAHVSFESAMLSAINEMIERDAIAMTWLAQLPLPKIEITKPVPSGLAPNLERLNKSLVQQHFFDATTDIGMPIAYTVQTLDGHPYVGQYVNCAAGPDPIVNIAKTIREAAPARFVFKEGYKHPDDVQDFSELEDGAAYLGTPDKRDAFNFLLKSENSRDIKKLEKWPGVDDKQKLQHLLSELKSRNMQVIAVDLTTDELRELGIWVVRVVIPDLMPMSATQRARFLGHPRLYNFYRDQGYGCLREDQINPLPQPFA